MQGNLHTYKTFSMLSAQYVRHGTRKWGQKKVGASGIKRRNEKANKLLSELGSNQRPHG